MRKIAFVTLLVALAVGCLSGCGKDKPEETIPPTLEVIEPETEETISDKLDDETVPDMKIEGVYIAPDGSVVSAEEDRAIEESIRYENSPMLQESLAAEGKEIPGGNAEPASESSESSSESSEPTSGSPEPTLSESEAAEAKERDFTEEEYQAIQNSIDEWTNAEAQERMKAALEYYGKE